MLCDGRDASGLCGVLNVLKPPGMTSHDVVAFVRRVSGIRRTGHTGTLDPGAAGVLPVCLGKATRISEYLTAMGKRYRAEVVLGVRTSTDDGAGETVVETDASWVTREDVERALANFRGEVVQRVPALSAKKVRGVHLYDIARSGKKIEERLVVVTIHQTDLLDFRGGRRAVATIDVSCGSGTYIRAICSDIGQALGCGAYMGFLLRTSAGPFQIEDCVTIEEIRDMAQAGRLREAMTDMATALSHLKGYLIADEAARLLKHGRQPVKEDITCVMEPRSECGQVSVTPSLVRLMDGDGGLVAVARLEGGDEAPEFILEKVFV